MSALTHLFSIPPPAEPEVEITDQPLSFSLGIPSATTLTRRQRLAEAKKRKAEKRKKHIFCIPPSSTLTHYTMIFRAKRWLLSDRGVPPAVSIFLYQAGENFQQIYKEIIKKRRRQNIYFAEYKMYLTSEPSIPMLKIFMQHAIKNQQIRNAFGVLARRWIRSKLSVKNTEDLVTGEAPLASVSLTDWRSRSIYIFEAKTILRDMLSRLLMSYAQFFPDPKVPRNPYTNSELSEGQFYSVLKQLKNLGETHWALEALYSSKYNLKEFENDMYTKLKRNIHNSIFSNPTSEVAKDVLLGFIDDQHSEHDATYEKDIYGWAVEDIPHHFRLHEWRIQCAKFYALRHFPGEALENAKEKDRILAATKRLCVYPRPLVEKYNEAHEAPYIMLADRVAPVLPTVQLVYTAVTISAEDMIAVLAAYAEDALEEATAQTLAADSHDSSSDED